MGVKTKPCQIKTLSIDFQEVEIGIKARIPDDGEDHYNAANDYAAGIDFISLYKTFPFSFMYGEKRIYGDFYIRVDEVDSEGKSPFWHGVILYNLKSFHASMDMSITSADCQRKINEIKTEFKESRFNSDSLIKSKINEEKLPYNETADLVEQRGLLDETLTNSHSLMTCKILIHFNPSINKAAKSNFKTVLCDNAIAQLENDKNFTLICDGQMFHFNKALLSMISEVFGRMIATSNSKESSKNSVDIEDFTPDTIKAFQRVAFGDEEIEDEYFTPELLMFAQKYLMKKLVLKIKARLMDSLSNENIFNVIKAAYLIDDQDMFKEASKYLLKNKDQLKGTPNWNAFKIEHSVCMIEALTI